MSEGGKLGGAKHGCEIAPCCAIYCRRYRTLPHGNWPRLVGAQSSWVKKWRKRLREGDAHDQELLCARSRAHHAPYFRLRPARRNLHCGNASVSTRASGTHARSPSPALLSAARPGPASRRGSLAPVQPNSLEASSENRLYSAQTTEEPPAH